MSKRNAALLAVLVIVTACDRPNRMLEPAAPKPTQEERLKALGIDKQLPPGVMLSEQQIAWLMEVQQLRKDRESSIAGGAEIEIAASHMPPPGDPLNWEPSFGAGMNQGDDDCRHVPLGFSFSFYGSTYTHVWVNSNGNMTFNGCNPDYWHTNVPDGGNRLVAPLYGDFNPAVNGDVYSNVIGSAPNRRFIATWHVVPEFGHGGSNTFQVQLYEGSNNIQFGYNGINTDGFSWCCGPFNVGISSGTGSFINSASGGAIPPLNGKNICYTPSGPGYTAKNGSCGPSAPPDPSPPTIVSTVTGTLGTNGWYTSNVSVAWSVTDSESLITSTTGCGPATINTDGAGVTITCTATSAGGTASKSVTIKRDATAPTVAGTITGTLGENGWYTSDVSVSFATSDAMSGVASSAGCDDSTISADTPGTDVTCTATDNAGNSASDTESVKRDATAPTVVGSVAGTLGTNGWYTSNVAVSFAVNDATSGIASSTGCAAASITADTPGMSFTCSATDNAGNKASDTESAKRDATAPTVVGSVAGTLGTNGWYTSDVSVSFVVNDAGSGIASSSTGCAASSVTADTPGTDVTCTATDNAGNSASDTESVKRDATAPTVVGSVAGTLGTNGWYTSDVAVSFAVNDATSGIASSTGCAAASITADTPGMSFTCSATDNAGNKASDTESAKRDATDPTVTYSGNAGTYSVDQNVNISCAASDNLSGVASSTCANIAGGAYTFALGANNYSASATDRAGNVGTGSTSFTVTVTHASLCALTTQFASKPGIANSLCAKLDAAAASAQRGNTGASANQLEAYRNEVSAQAGKSLTTAQAAILSRLSQAL